MLNGYEYWIKNRMASSRSAVNMVADIEKTLVSTPYMMSDAEFRMRSIVLLQSKLSKFNPKAVSIEELIHDMLQYCQTKNSRDYYAYQLLRTVIFHICWRENFENKKLLHSLILEYWRIGGTLHILFDQVHLWVDLKWDAVKKTELLDKWEYILRHTTDLKLPKPYCHSRFKECCHKIPFIDAASKGESAPLGISLRYHYPDAVLLLLRYGACVETVLVEIRNLFQFYSKVQSIIVSKPSTGIVEFEDYRDLTDIELCFAYLCRAMTSFTHSLDYRHFDSSHTKENYKKVLKRLIPTERLTDPCQLSQLCRISIRESLRKSSRLPLGIKTLPLPRLLLDYIDLAHD